MNDISSSAWVVLEAAHDLASGDPEASIDAEKVHTLALERAADADAAAELADGIDAQTDELQAAGHIAVDVGLAPATARGNSAAYTDNDFGMRVTPAGFAAIAARGSN